MTVFRAATLRTFFFAFHVGAKELIMSNFTFMVMAFLFFDVLPSEESALCSGAITKCKKVKKTIKYVRERTGVHNQNAVLLKLSDAS